MTLIALWVLSDWSLIAPWVLWLISDLVRWSLTALDKFETNGRTSEFLELLSEPKIFMSANVTYICFCLWQLDDCVNPVLFILEGIVNPTKQLGRNIRDKERLWLLAFYSYYGDSGSQKWAVSNTMYQRGLYFLLICVSTTAAIKVVFYICLRSI